MMMLMVLLMMILMKLLMLMMMKQLISLTGKVPLVSDRVTGWVTIGYFLPQFHLDQNDDEENFWWSKWYWREYRSLVGRAIYMFIYLDSTITTITSWDVCTLAGPDVLCELPELFLLNLGFLMNLGQLVQLVLKKEKKWNMLQFDWSPPPPFPPQKWICLPKKIRCRTFS